MAPPVDTMPGHSLPYLANCSLLFTEHPLLERAAAAKAAGFDAVEFWWPFETAVPADAHVDAFVASIADAGVQLVALNFYAGDLAGPDSGVLSIPARSSQFRDNVAVTVGIGSRLGAIAFNAPYGNRIAGVSPSEQDDVATENLALAASAAAPAGATVLVEAVSGPKPYPLRSAADAIAVVDRVRAAGATNIACLCDLYHLAVNGDDIDAAIGAFAPKIAHVQVADAPGRCEPGGGDLDLDRYLCQLQDAGYDGWVSLEYVPTGKTVASLGWLPTSRRGAPAGRQDRTGPAAVAEPD